MIVIERAYMAKIIRALKAAMNSEDQRYRTGYIVALSTVEGVMAVAPEYDLDKLFTPEEVCAEMVKHGQGNYKRFKLGDTIQYSPTEVMKILKDELPKAL